MTDIVPGVMFITFRAILMVYWNTRTFGKLWYENGIGMEVIVYVSVQYLHNRTFE